MKKFGVIFAIIAIAALVGCGSTGGGGGGGGSGDVFIVDLSTMIAMETATSPDRVVGPTGETVKNAKPFAKNYDDLMLVFPEMDIDITAFSRITITCKYFNEDGNELAQGDGNAMVVLVNDLAGDWRGPAMGPGPNTPLKEFNVGGFSGQVNTDRGSRIRLSTMPAGILFQNSNIGVKYIECTSIVFHNGDYESK